MKHKLTTFAQNTDYCDSQQLIVSHSCLAATLGTAYEDRMYAATACIASSLRLMHF